MLFKILSKAGDFITCMDEECYRLVEFFLSDIVFIQSNIELATDFSIGAFCHLEILQKLLVAFSVKSLGDVTGYGNGRFPNLLNKILVVLKRYFAG